MCRKLHAAWDRAAYLCEPSNWLAMSPCSGLRRTVFVVLVLLICWGVGNADGLGSETSRCNNNPTESRSATVFAAAPVNLKERGPSRVAFNSRNAPPPYRNTVPFLFPNTSFSETNPSSGVTPVYWLWRDITGGNGSTTGTGLLDVMGGTIGAYSFHRWPLTCIISVDAASTRLGTHNKVDNDPAVKDRTATTKYFIGSPPKIWFEKGPLIWRINSVEVGAFFRFSGWNPRYGVTKSNPMRNLESISVVEASPDIYESGIPIKLPPFCLGQNYHFSIGPKFYNRSRMRILNSGIKYADLHFRDLRFVRLQRGFFSNFQVLYNNISSDGASRTFPNISNLNGNFNTTVILLRWTPCIGIVCAEHHPTSLLHLALIRSVQPQKESDSGVNKACTESEPSGPHYPFLYGSVGITFALLLSYWVFCKSNLDSSPLVVLLLLLAFVSGAGGVALVLNSLAYPYQQGGDICQFTKFVENSCVIHRMC